MEEIALPRRSSTLAPPPLETAARGTRALQRFDLGSARRKRDAAGAPEPASEIEVIVSTVRMSIPESVKNLPPVEESMPRTITLPIPRPLPLRLPLRLPISAAPQRRLVLLREAVWAMAASASLLAIGSIATVMVYVLLFP